MMKFIKRLRFPLLLFFLMSISLLSFASVNADDTKTEVPNPLSSANQCGKTDTFFDFNPANNDGDADTKKNDCGQDSVGDEENGIFIILLFIANIISGLVGIAAAGAIIYGGVLFSSAQDDPEKKKKGIAYIRNALIVIVGWVMLYSVMNFLIPGGLFT